MKTFYLLALLSFGLFHNFWAVAQDENNAESTKTYFWGVHASANFSQSAPHQKIDPYIRRQNPAIFYDGSSDNEILSWSEDLNFGVSVERRLGDNRWGLSLGLQVKWMDIWLNRDNTFNDTEYFNFRYRHTPTSTEYLRIKEIQQTSTYLSIPIEARYFLSSHPSFRFYLKAGFEINQKVSYKGSVSFDNPTMKIHEEEVLDVIGETSPFYSAAYSAIGMSWGRVTSPNFYIETTLPYYTLDQDFSILMSNRTAIGLKVGLLFP